MSRKATFLIGLMIALVIAAGAASIYAYNRAYDYFANDLPIFAEIVAQPQQIQVAQATARPDDVIKLPEPWNGKERVNILLLGIDQRVGENDPCYRTDTMIVFTLDPVTMQAGMLSIPRDIWVPIPGYNNNRINTANCIGDTQDYPGGGMALAEKTVENFLGVDINYAARVNFTAFENFVDRIGGVDIDVPQDIYDATYPTNDYGTEVFSLNKGLQTLDGATALKYARTRHSGNGDFDRARRQQQVIIAVKEKLQDPRTMASLVSQAPALLNDLSTSVKTDMTLDQIQQLAVLATKIERNKIKSEVLDQRYTMFATTPEGYEVIIPNRERIAALRTSFFSTEANAAVENSVSNTVATPAAP
jgi:LCP family protein required for cell wall assembly